MDAPMPNRLPVFFVLLLLSGLLLAAAGAHGASAGPVASPSALEEDFEGLEEELEEEGEEEDEASCEGAEVEFELGEIDEAEAEEVCREAAGSRGKDDPRSPSVAPRECILRSAHTHASVNSAGDKLKLTIGYTAYEPVAAKVEVRKGASRIATKRLQLGRSGVLRIVKGLGRARAPKLVVVRLAVAASPGYCGKYETEKVRVH
jgi:hypothetical protein